MIILAIIISLISLCIAVITYCNFKIQQQLVDEQTKRLTETQIKIYEFYNFLRTRRNEVYIERIKYEDSLDKAYRSRTKNAYKIGIFVVKREEKLLRQLEEHLQQEHLI